MHRLKVLLLVAQVIFSAYSACDETSLSTPRAVKVGTKISLDRTLSEFIAGVMNRLCLLGKAVTGRTLSYKDILSSSAVLETTKKAVRRALKGYPSSLRDRISFIISLQEHPFCTPAEVVGRSTVILYPSFFAYSSAEQAAILAHECAHIFYWHFEQRFATSVGLIALSFLAERYIDDRWHDNSITRVLAKIGFALGGILSMRRFANSHESQADLKAAQALKDTRGLLSVFTYWAQYLQQHGCSPSSWWQDWFGSHPSLATRIKRLQALSF